METKDIQQLGILARISVQDQEAVALKGQLEQILAYVGEVANAPVITTSPIVARQIVREDVPQQSPHVADVIEAFPQKEGRFAKVPKVL
jgi:aspartyl/glutamyl-tRNA(Asn/Gln) amidotransferase C subunit